MGEETPKLVGDRIRKRREDLGLNPVDLANAAGCSISAVLQWESNKTKNLKLDNLFAIADALGLEPRWLAIGKGDKEATKVTVRHEPIRRIRVGEKAQQNQKSGSKSSRSK